jgi:hypothetical protein
VSCLKPRQLNKVDGLNGILEEKSIGVKILFQENDNRFNFGIRKVNIQRTRGGWKVTYIGDAYAENCSGLD